VTLLIRIFVILFALLLASFAAGLVVALAVLFPAFSDLDLGMTDQGLFNTIIVFGAIFVSGFALIPALLLVVVSEGLGIRSFVFYAAAGAVAGFVIYWSFAAADLGALTLNSNTRREAEIMTGAGIIAGMVYWAIAGRNAGFRRRTTEDG
jgi:hypothetical protein